MSGTLKGLLAAMIVLGALAWLMGPDKAPAPPTGWSIAGYATAEQLEADKNRGMLDPQVDMPSPIDAIEIQRPGEPLIRLVRKDGTDKPDWKLESPREAPAVRFRVDTMVKLFKDETTSIHSTRISPEERPLFDLEDSRAILVKVFAGGEVHEGLDLRIGKVDKSEEDSADAPPGNRPKDTWIMVAGQDDVAYRIGGKDLREPFEAKMADLRDRRLFTIKNDDLVRLTLTPPGQKGIGLSGDREETPGASPGDAPKVTVAWSFSEKSPFNLDQTAASTLARSLANARAKDFKEPEGDSGGVLGEGHWVLSGTTHDGKELGLRVSAAEGDEVWAQLTGTEEFLLVDKHTAKNLRQTLADLRDRDLVGGALEDTLAFSLSPEDGKPYAVARRQDGWAFARGKLKGKVDPGPHLNSILSAKAQRHARPDELAQAEEATDKPDFKAAVKTTDRDVAVAFGPKMESDPYKGQRWARLESGDETNMVLIQDHTARRFRKKAADLRWKKLFAYGKGNTRKLEITAPGEKTAALTLVTDPDGKLIPSPLPDSKATKDSEIRTLVTTLETLSAKEFHPRAKARKVGLSAADAWTLDITLDGGQQRALLLAPKGEDDPMAVTTGGPLSGQVVSLNPFQADKLRKRLEDMVE